MAFLLFDKVKVIAIGGGCSSRKTLGVAEGFAALKIARQKGISF
jgi:hypothetical protein